MWCYLYYRGGVIVTMRDMIILIVLSIISALLAFFIIYGIVIKKIPKVGFVVALCIEICVILAIFSKDILYFSLLGILGGVLLVLAKLKNIKK